MKIVIIGLLAWLIHPGIDSFLMFCVACYAVWFMFTALDSFSNWIRDEVLTVEVKINGKV